MKPLSRAKSHVASAQKKSRIEDADGQPLSEAFEARKKLALSSIVYIRFEGPDALARVPEGIDPSIPYPVQLQPPVIKLNPASITIESLLTGMERVRVGARQ